MLSLLISAVLFACFTVLVYTGFFDMVEARFYNPSLINALNRELAGDAALIEGYLTELQTRFAATLGDDAVRRSFAATQDTGDIRQRSALYGTLMESFPGLQSVRFVDAQGRRIHYSTWQPDILRADRDSITYQNYTESPGYIPYWQVEAGDHADPRLFMDDIGERIIFSYPFSNVYGVYQGTALFSFSARGLAEKMAGEGRIAVGDDITVISAPSGIVTGLPHAGKSAIIPLIAQMWSDNILSLGRLHAGLTDTKLALISTKTGGGIFIGRLVDESLLGFPQIMRIILLASFLLTVFLTLFLIFNIRQDNMTIIQNRIKRLQINLIEEYYDHKGDIDWERWRRDMQQRRKELHTELKRDLHSNGKGTEGAEIDALIDKSWDELLAAIGGGGGSGIDEAKLKALLDQFRRTAPANAPPPKPPEASEELEELEELEDVEKMEAVEELTEVEELEEVKEVEELEELEEFEPPKPAPKTRELTPQELADPGEDFGRVNPASEIEFSPPPEELEKQKEAAAKSMVAQFQIQSPFSEILSGLSVVKDPMDNMPGLVPVDDDEPGELLSLEEEGEEVPELDAAGPSDQGAAAEGLSTGEIKPLNMHFIKPLLSVPVSAAPHTEIEVLAIQDVDDAGGGKLKLPSGKENTVITARNGVNYINKSILNPDKGTTENLDGNFKHLVESVLAKD